MPRTNAATELDRDFSGVKAIFLNCTLKPSPGMSYTGRLIRIARMIMEKRWRTDRVDPTGGFRAGAGVFPDMTEHGAAHDDWPTLLDQVMAATILVIGTPIWPGDKSSVCRRVVERLHAASGCSTRQGSMRTMGESVDAWSPVTRAAPNTAR